MTAQQAKKFLNIKGINKAFIASKLYPGNPNARQALNKMERYKNMETVSEKRLSQINSIRMDLIRELEELGKLV